MSTNLHRYMNLCSLVVSLGGMVCGKKYPHVLLIPLETVRNSVSLSCEHVFGFDRCVDGVLAEAYRRAVVML